MAVPLLQAPLPFERHDIRSGPITRAGFGDYGVIFSSRPNVSPQDFHPADLTGAVIEVLELRDKGESNRFFTILGGYYCERNPGGRSGEVAISHIFGIAADASLGFGLSPGNHCLVDEWEMKDLSGNGRKNMMDERSKGESGWTFIVNFKPFRHQYPYSGKPMGIARECPQLTGLTVSQTASSDTTLTASGQATLLNGPARGFRWDWGDGSPIEETATPDASHTFQRSAGSDQSFTVTISTIGPDGCASQQSATFVVPGFCPVMQAGPSEVSYPSDTHAIALLTLLGPHQDDMTYEWNWGDGSDVEQTTQPNATHRYDRTTDQVTFKVEVLAVGPGTCRSGHSFRVSVDPRPCPVVTGIVMGEGQMNGDQYELTATAELAGEPASEYHWDWGDGSPVETTMKPQATHAYTPAAGASTDLTITVTAIGPGSSCQSTASTSVTIPGVCPLPSLFATVGAVSETHAEVTLTLASIGPVPESWSIDWGDGSAAETVAGTQATHQYQRPAGEQQAMSISATATGPGNCSSQASTSVVIPGACPALSDLLTEWTGVTGQLITLHASVNVSGPTPTEMVWDFGDGSDPLVTNETSVTHEYAGKPGEEQLARLRVTAKGPGPCTSELSTDLKVPALPCPVLRQLKVTPGAISGSKQSFAFSADFEGPVPGGFRWNWGDGTPEETTDSPAGIHSYPVLPGESKTYRVMLTSVGPGTCQSATHGAVEVGAACPLPGEVAAHVQAATDGAVTVDASVAITGPAPSLYLWNWGDGSPEEETTAPKASHTYAATPGKIQQKTLTVTIQGPGECGDRTVSTGIVLPAGCPVLQPVEAVQQALTDQTVTFGFSVPVAGKADTYVWDFGDGSATESTSEPTASHEYPRWAGQSPTFEVRVKALGPGSCVAESTVKVQIPEAEICPLISRIDTYVAAEADETVTMGFIPVFLHGAPDRYEWNFGDGSAPLSTTDPEVVHEYARSAGSGIEVTVTGSGPGSCVASQKVLISIPGKATCPEVGALTLVGKNAADPAKYEVSATLEVVSGKPDQYIWQWGDGSAAQTTQHPAASHTFSKDSSPAARTVKVTAKGPGACDASATEAVTIPAFTTSHPWCRWWPWLVGFLGSLAAGGWLVCPAAHQDPTPSSWLFWVLLILILGFGVVAWMWYSLGRKRDCPPNLCNGLSVGWTMMLTMSGVAFFLNDCLPGWMGWGIVTFVLAAVLAGWWFARCARFAGAMRFFIWLLIAALAFVLVVVALAMPVLACV